MKYPRRLEFINLGSLPWPFGLKGWEVIGNLVEVTDTKGVAVFSLEDIRLGDLEHRK